MTQARLPSLPQAWLLSLATAVPAHTYAQAEMAETLLELVPLPPDDARRFRRMAAGSGIETRHSALPDYRQGSARIMYPDTPDFEPVPNLETRMACFHELALPLGLDAARQALAEAGDTTPDAVTHLIAVSCTGLAAPGLDLMLMRALELAPDTARSGVNFMGCYAAMHALKQAEAICRADSRALVLVVCVELCSLHFQKDPSPDNLAASLLFADGAAAALVGGAAQRKRSARPVALQGFYSEVAFAGWQDMAWQLSGQGFLMRLSAYVPELLRQGIRPLVTRALAQQHLGIDDVDHWAIHPGGRKILDLALSELGLAPDALQAAYEVLRDYGNMSSPTILFVLKALQPAMSAGETVFAAAFGPGLTMETLVAVADD